MLLRVLRLIQSVIHKARLQINDIRAKLGVHGTLQHVEIMKLIVQA